MEKRLQDLQHILKIEMGISLDVLREQVDFINASIERLKEKRDELLLILKEQEEHNGFVLGKVDDIRSLLEEDD